jgi:heterodisulfide reductase subunit C
MNNTIFSIGSQQAGRDIYNIARDLNINQNSSSEDVLKIFEAIQQKVVELGIDEKDKRKINNHIDNAKIELEDKNPDRNSIEESIKKTSEILINTKTTGETLKDIGILVGKAAKWLGTTAAALGWIL